MLYDTVPSDDVIGKTVSSLQENGMTAFVAQNGDDAVRRVRELLSEEAEIMTMTSVTLDTLGLSKEINESGNYHSVRSLLTKMDRAREGHEMQKLGAAPECVIGSVHAVTEDGHVFIASNTGSQLPAYVYGSGKVIWVVGAQKIVKNSEEALKRIYDYTLPLESERAHKAYGVPGSFVSKLLIVNRETTENRIFVILAKEVLGF